MRRPRDLVVLDFDGIVLLGAVVNVDRRGTVEIRRHASSTAATPEAALEEVLGALGRTPVACVVRSAEVVAGVVHLPIASARGRTPDEVREMLRWELEPLHAQQTVVPPLGAILEARRHIEHAQVETVLAAMQARRAAGDRDAGSLRFGTMARELGFVTDDQLTEALAIQERLGRPEEEHVCGWAVQRGSSGAGGTPWLAVGMPAARRRFWAERLAARGLRLLALYPRLPGALGAIDRHASATLVEVESHAVSRSVVKDGALVSVEILPISDAEPAARVCRELLEGTDPAATFVCGPLAGAAAGVVVFEPPVRGAVEGGPAAWAGVAGAARHAAGHGGPLAAVPARDPGPSLLRRTGVRWAAAILLVAAVAAGMDRLTARSLSRAVQGLGEAQERLDKLTRQIREAEQRGTDAGAIATEISALEKERDALLHRLRVLEEGVAARARLLPELLDALAAAANDEVLVDRTNEESPGRIRVEGRALSERSVQAFAQSVAARVLPLRLRVVDQAIRKGSLRGATAYYSFGFVLEPLSEGDA
jgi:hypothetical protein